MIQYHSDHTALKDGSSAPLMHHDDLSDLEALIPAVLDHPKGTHPNFPWYICDLLPLIRSRHQSSLIFGQYLVTDARLTIFL